MTPVEFLRGFFFFAVLAVLATAFDGEAVPAEVSPPPARSSFVKPVINEEGWATSGWAGSGTSTP